MKPVVKITASSCALGALLLWSPVGVTSTAAYLGAFDPANIKSNYLSDSPTQFSMNVPGLADFTVVVTSTSATDVAFGLTVGGCGQMVLTGVTPAFGPVTGATPITISGSGFATTAPLTVTIGAAAATTVPLA